MSIEAPSEALDGIVKLSRRSQALEGSSKGSVSPGHRQVEELQCGNPDDHAFGEP